MPSSSLHHCSRHYSSSRYGHEKPKHSTYDSFPASPSTRSSLERPTRGHSRDSAYSRSDREGSYDRLINQPDPSNYSHMNRAPKFPSYDRMVCAAIARLKNRKGSSIREIAKNVRDKYGLVRGFKSGSESKISSTARRLVKSGKLVKDGTHFRLRRERSRKDGSDARRRHRHGGESTGKRSSSPAPRQYQRAPSQRHSRSRSRSRGRCRRRRKGRRRRSRRRGGQRSSGGGQRSSGGSSLSRGRGKRRKKGGMRSQKRRLSYGRRFPNQRKYTRNKRKVKHSYRGRPKAKVLPQENSENKGWFGSWFGRGNTGQSSNSGQSKGSGSGANKSGNKGGNKDSGKQAAK